MRSDVWLAVATSILFKLEGGSNYLVLVHIAGVNHRPLRFRHLEASGLKSSKIELDTTSLAPVDSTTFAYRTHSVLREHG